MIYNSKPEVNIKYSDESKAALACIFEVQQEVSVVEGGENTQGGRYKYARLGDMQAAIKPYLMKHRCIYLFGTDSSTINSEYVKLQGRNDATPRDKLVTFAYWSGSVTLLSIDNPKDWVKVSGYGFKVDQISDKALGAVTIGKRYLLASLFGFTTGDDPDNDESDIRRFSSGSSPHTPAQTMAAPPTNNNPLSSFLS